MHYGREKINDGVQQSAPKKDSPWENRLQVNTAGLSNGRQIAVLNPRDRSLTLERKGEGATLTLIGHGNPVTSS